MYAKTFQDLRNYVDYLTLAQDERLMIMVADKSSSYVNGMMEHLNSLEIPFFGGIFPKLLAGNRCESEGFIVKRIPSVAYCSLVLPYLMKFRENPESFSGCTAITLVDGLSSRMQDLTSTIFGKLGNHVRYVGGGAGFFNLEHKPCIFDNKGLYQDVLYLCITRHKVDLAVKHGWNKLQGPFTVDKSEGNILSVIDGDNAFELYREMIEKIEGVRLFKEDFFLFAKDHPFGVVQDDGSIVVRDPIAVNENNEIVLVASIPKESQIYVLKGDADTLLSSSLQIAEECASKAPENYVPLLFDCISRAMFLEEGFEEELDNIQAKLKYKVEGALSIGEIASKRNGDLVIHNKSTVIGLLSEEN